MATQNRLGWTVRENDHGTFDVVNRFGATVDIDGFRRAYDTSESATVAIDAEIARRNRRNGASRARHELMTGIGLVRCRNGSYE